MALKVVQMLRDEIKLYENHSNDYSYAFYGMRKNKQRHSQKKSWGIS